MSSRIRCNNPHCSGRCPYGPAANAFGQAESVYPAITYDALLLNRAPTYIYSLSNACVRTYDIYTIHSGIRGPIQVHLGGGRSRATTRICILLILLGCVSALCVVILCWPSVSDVTKLWCMPFLVRIHSYCPIVDQLYDDVPRELNC